MEIEKVAVIGTGQMGPGIAAIIALAGCEVTLIGEKSEWADDGVNQARAVMDWLLQNDLAMRDAVARAKPRVRGTADLDAGVRGVQLVVEAVSENLALKQ